MSKRLGESRCQCPRCGDYFNSTAAFDKHRTGKYAKPGESSGTRRCRTGAEMMIEGMERNGAGFWITGRWEQQ